ncbi:MAG: hypothetical protein VXW38_11225 [Bacteroidota bacterium]|nr:hypothetical protein [Bacteroidota bacterium]
MFRKITLSIFVLFALFSCSSDSGGEEPAIVVELPTVNSVSAISITDTSAVVGGNVTDNGGGTVSARGVAWGVSSNPTVAGTKTTNGTGTGEFSASLSGLQKNTQYYFRAYATNSKGTAYGSEMTFTTNASLAVVTTKQITDLSDVSAMSGGVVVDDGGISITSKGVCWATTENPTIENNKTEDGSGSDEFDSLLSSLSPNTQYYVRAYVVNAEGVSYGNAVTFTTNPSLASLTTNAVTGLADTSAISGGTITSDGGAQVVARGISWSTSPNPTVDDNFSLEGTGIGDFESVMSSLLPSTQYYVRAYATNAAGTAYGNELSFTTLEKNTIYDGDVTLLSQQEVDDFGAQGYTEITGSLTIGDNTGIITDIDNLDALSSLETLGFHLNIYNNDSLTNLDGLSGIGSVGGNMIIGLNDLFTNLDGLNSVTTIGGNLEIYGNDLLQNIQGLSNVTTLGGLVRFQNNYVLSSLDGFPSVNQINGSLTIRQNNITNLNGLQSLTSVLGNLLITNETALSDISGIQGLTLVEGDFTISGTALTEISGFSSLNTVAGLLTLALNGQLTSISGFANLSTNAGLRIQNNDLLNSIAGFGSITTVTGDLQININSALSSINIFGNLTAVEGDVSISSNNFPDLSFLSGLTSVGGNVYIANSSAFTSLTGVENINQINGNLTMDSLSITTTTDFSSLVTLGGNLSVGNNSSLQSIGFGNITYVNGDIQISNNISITDYCGLQDLLLNGGLTGTFTTTNNLFNPTAQDIINGNCSN